MNDKELQNKVCSAMCSLIKEKGFISPVDVLMSINVLDKKDYEKWRFGKISYLESVCKINLKKLSSINREIRIFAKNNNLKPSWTDYRKWGKGNSIHLRFSKSGEENIERQYSTHYIFIRKAE